MVGTYTSCLGTYKPLTGGKQLKPQANRNGTIRYFQVFQHDEQNQIKLK